MTESLLEAPERGAIEAVLQKCQVGVGQAPTFEQVLGFLTGAAITPCRYATWYWLQPLFDLNGIVLLDLDELDPFSASLLALYDRVDAKRLRGEPLLPFDLKAPELVEGSALIMKWVKGLQAALTVEEDIWIPYEDEAEEIDAELKNEVNITLQCLDMLVHPQSIPEIMKDPIPFQRNILSECPGWPKELRETWDEELKEMLKYFCLARLDSMLGWLLRYAKVYDETQYDVIDCSTLNLKSPPEPVIEGTEEEH